MGFDDGPVALHADGVGRAGVDRVRQAGMGPESATPQSRNVISILISLDLPVDGSLRQEKHSRKGPQNEHPRQFSNHSDFFGIRLPHAP